MEHDADVSVSSSSLDDLGHVTMTAPTPWGSVELRVPVPGAHMASNALAALVIAGACGVSMSDAARGIAGAELSPMRMESHTTVGGTRIVADCYNANPASVAAALRTIAAMRATRRVAVLGLMAELADAEREHKAITSLAAELGIEVVAVDTSLYGARVVTLEEATALVAGLGDGDVALVKGSRVARLERVVSALGFR